MSDWSKVTREDVIKAIEKFNKEKPDYAKSRTTYLVYDNTVYPGKQIRRMAYEIAVGVESDHFYGGESTVDFYENLGFDTYWTKRDGEIPEYEMQIEDSNEYCKIKKTENDRRKQKEYLQDLLYNIFGQVETEKTYDWATTPRKENTYADIIANIEKMCGTRSFADNKCNLKFDFACEKQKVIIEYDEQQHFTKQRKIALKSYPSDIHLYYSKEIWLKACDDINARMKKKKDPLRDEKRAFYDSVRDIEAYRHGYKLIRIMHGQFDFSRDDAKEYLLELIGD